MALFVFIILFAFATTARGNDFPLQTRSFFDALGDAARCKLTFHTLSNGGTMLTGQPHVLAQFFLAAAWHEHVGQFIFEGELFGARPLEPILGTPVMRSTRAATPLSPAEDRALSRVPCGKVEIAEAGPEALIRASIEVDKYLETLRKGPVGSEGDPKNRFYYPGGQKLTQADLDGLVGKLVMGSVDAEPHLLLYSGKIQKVFMMDYNGSRVVHAEILTPLGKTVTIRLTWYVPSERFVVINL